MKKSEFISFRCSEKVKNMIEADSIEKEWTISHTVEKILTEYYERKNRRSKADCTKYTFLYSYLPKSQATLSGGFFSLQSAPHGALPKNVIETRYRPLRGLGL